MDQKVLARNYGQGQHLTPCVSYNGKFLLAFPVLSLDEIRKDFSTLLLSHLGGCEFHYIPANRLFSRVLEQLWKMRKRRER